MDRAIIMDMTSRHWIVMTAGGQFKKVIKNDHNRQIGDEINLPRTTYFQKRNVISAAVACVVLCFFIVTVISSGLFSNSDVVAAYVSIDVNPSIELGVDHKARILEVSGINEGGIKLLEAAGDLQGLQADEAAKVIFQSAMSMDLLGPYMKEGVGNIVISSTIVADDSDSFDETTITKNMAAEIYGVFENEEAAINGTVAITNLYTPKELRDEARKHGVSAGKVAIRLLSIEQGQHLEWEELQEKAIAQIAEELGGWDQLIATDEEITKDRLKELYNLQKQTVQMPNDVKTSNSKEEEDEEPSSLDTEVDDIEAVPESSKQNSTRNLPAFVKQPDNDDVSYTLASSQVSESEEMVQLKNVENRGNHGNDGSRVSRLKERAKEQTRHHDHGQRKMKKRDRHGPKEQKAESTDDFAQKERRQSHHHTDNDQAKNQRHRKNHQGKHRSEDDGERASQSMKQERKMHKNGRKR